MQISARVILVVLNSTFNEEWGEWVQIAVHSWGDENCTMTSGSTRTDLVHDWILETVVSVHGTTDFCDINGYYDDDECTTISMPRS